MVPENGRITVRKTYTNGEKRTPYKWHAVCPCGHNIASWDWDRIIGHVGDHITWHQTGSEPAGWARMFPNWIAA
jgi:hypothetical protein